MKKNDGKFIRRNKIFIEKELVSLAKRIVKLDASYNAARDKMMAFNGDDPERVPLAATAKRLALQKDKLSKVFTELTNRHEQLTYISKLNREENKSNGEVFRLSEPHNVIQPT